MLLHHLVINRYLEAIQKHSKLVALLEDAGGALMATARIAKSDLEKLEKLDLEQLADIITAIKLLTDSNYRSAMTRSDVGIDPNNAEQLLKMLDTIPSDPAKQLPTAARDFVKSVALMSKSLRAKELASLKELTSSDRAKREQAHTSLGKLASLIASSLEKLRAKVR